MSNLLQVKIKQLCFTMGAANEQSPVFRGPPQTLLRLKLNKKIAACGHFRKRACKNSSEFLTPGF
jgi:hypothetical protein